MRTASEYITLACTVDGCHEQLKVPALAPLVEVLRDYLGKRGTKKGCATGQCGACTVLLNQKPVPSCLVPAIQCQNKEIITIDYFNKDRTAIAHIEEAFLTAGAVQCGFCTPGFILSTAALLRDNPHPSPQQIRQALSGNLCRCTGYAKIFQAVELAAERLENAATR